MRSTFILHLICILSLSSGCETVKNKSECLIDRDFRLKFENCIQIVHLTNHGYMMDEDHLSKAYNCLYAITNVHSIVPRSGGAAYFYPYSESRNYYFEDVDNWYKWYEQNKCTITIQIADSLIKAFSKLDGNEYDWPPSVVKIIECN